MNEVSDREIVIEEVVKPGYTLPPSLFWEAHSIAFSALTTYFGLGPSIVTWETIERGAAFRIRLPKRRPIRFILSRLASWFRNDDTDDIRRALLFGHERSIRLEREIAERRATEAALKASEERFRRISDAIPDIVYQYFLDPDGQQGFTFVSNGSTKLTGFTPAELIQRSDLIWERIDPVHLAHVQASVFESARNGTPWQQEFRFQIKSGEYRWFRGSSVPEAATDSGRIIWNGIISDVTAKREADEQLHARDALLRKLSEQVPGFIYQYQQWPDGRSCFPYASDGIREIYEVAPDEVRDLADCVFRRIHHDDIEHVVEHIQHSMETLKPWICEYRVILPSRGTRWLDGHAVPERMTDGSTVWHGYIRDVTDRKQVEDSIRESENRFRTLIEDLDVGVVLQDQSDRILISNRAAATILGLTPEQLQGTSSRDPDWALIREDGEQLPLDEVPSVIAARTRQPVRNVILSTIHRQTGRRTWLQVNATPRLNSDNSLRHVLVSLVDITERKLVNDALALERDRLRTLGATAPGVLHSYRLRPDGARQFIYLSPRVSELFPFTPEELAEDATRIRASFHPEDLDRHLTTLAESARTLTPINTEYRIINPVRGELWVRIQSAPILEPDGSIVWHGFILDVTEQKRAENEIRRARDAAEQALVDLRIASTRAERFYQLCEAAGQGIGISNLDGTLLYLNPAFRRMLEIPDGDDVAARTFWELVPKDSHQYLSETILVQTRESGTWSGEFEILTLSGKRLPIINTLTLLRDPDGTVVGYSNIATDITHLKQVERALRASEEKIRAIVNNEPECVKLLDREGKLLEMNPAGLRMIEADHFEDVRGTCVCALVEPHNRTDFNDMIEAVFRGATSTLVFEIVTLKGNRRTLETQSVPMWDSDHKEVLALLGVTRDITERRRAEEALRISTRRMEMAFAATSDAIWEWNYQTNETYYSPRWYEMLGYDSTMPMILETWKQLCHPDDLEPTLDRIRSILDDPNSTRYEVEFRMKRSDGSWAWILGRGDVMERMPDGSPRLLAGTNTDITERKLSEQALRESELRFRTLFETSSDAIFMMDLTGRILSVNPAAARMHGYSLDELLSMRIQDLDLPEFSSELPERMRRLKNGETLTFEVIHRRKDGSTFPLEVVASAVEIGGQWYVIGFDRDISDRKQAEAALLLAERRQRLALDSARMGTWEWTIGSSRLNWDAREERLFGFQPGEFDQRIETFIDRIHPDDLTAVRKVLDDAAAGNDFDGEFRIILQDGSIRWIHGTGTVIPQNDQYPARLVGINYDITERKFAEQALMEEKSLLQALFASLPGIVFAFDIHGRYLRWNQNYKKLLGWSDEEMSKLTALDTIAPRDRERVANVIRDVFLHGESATELHAVTKSGQELPLYCSGVRVMLGGQPCLVGYGIDISDRIKAEAALRESEERLRIFVQNAPAGVAMFDRELRYISYSRRWLLDYGLGETNLIGRSHYEVFPEVTERWKEIHRRCLQGASERCEQDRFERADGSVDYIRWEIQPWTEAKGNVGGLVFFSELITDRVLAEEQIRASLREKEAMLKEIHHRVKNNLQVISSLLSLQAARVTNPVAADVLAESQNRVRAMALVHETLYRSDDLAHVNLARYLGELCGFLFRSYGMDMSRVRLDLAVEPVTISLDKTIPCGLLVNEIVSNSLKYAFPGNRNGKIMVQVRSFSDGHLNLTLADDGIGLPDDIIVDRTPTLGLQLVNILTEQLGGQLSVQRSQGTSFTISFTP